MLVGYNTNVPYKGKLYHVQTEDNGLKNPMVITLLYLSGTILSAKKTNYAEVIGSPDYKEKIRELMKEQHKNMIKDLIHGRISIEQTEQKPAEAPPEAKAEAIAPEPEPAPKGQISKSLDDILLDYIIKGER